MQAGPKLETLSKERQGRQPSPECASPTQKCWVPEDEQPVGGSLNLGCMEEIAAQHRAKLSCLLLGHLSTKGRQV